MRVYINLTQPEFEVLEREAKKSGIAISMYIKNRALEGQTVAPYELGFLTQKLLSALKDQKRGEPFTCAELMEETWHLMTVSQKSSVSFMLKREIERHPGKYEVVGRTYGKTNRYTKLK